MPRGYYVIPDAGDNCPVQINCEPVALSQVGDVMVEFLRRYEHQGYFFNCYQQRIELDEVKFTVQPEEESEEAPEHSREARDDANEEMAGGQ
jgi:hypothetical protein